MANPMNQLTVTEARKEFNRLVDNVVAKFEQLNLNETGLTKAADTNCFY